VGVTASGDGGAALLGVTELGEAGLGLAELSVVGLFVADVTAGEGVGASRGAGTGAELAAVDEGAAGADVTAESLVVGATGSGVRVEGGASTLDGAEGATTTGASVVGTAAAGAFSTEDGATDGTSAGLDFSAGARVAAGGSGSTVVDGAPGEPGEPGAANAGATPPVSAVNEMTTPDARTAQTVRLRQIFNGAPIAHRLLRTLPRHCSRTQRPHSGLSADRQFRYSPGTRGRAGGTAASRARVYSSSGSAKSSTAGRYSTATPERMTRTSWLTCWITARSWPMKR
jgi:hypothetical protein